MKNKEKYAKEIVELHGGSISAISEQEETVFSDCTSGKV